MFCPRMILCAAEMCDLFRTSNCLVFSHRHKQSLRFSIDFASIFDLVVPHWRQVQMKTGVSYRLCKKINDSRVHLAIDRAQNSTEMCIFHNLFPSIFIMLERLDVQDVYGVIFYAAVSNSCYPYREEKKKKTPVLCLET
jgi:hypothetical protein